jgi:basic amino acid/polyamine antiporter, APA family
VIQTATIAAVAVAFARFSSFIFEGMSESNILLDAGFLSISAAQVSAIILIVVLTYVNTRGVQGGKMIQSVFTVAKLVALFGLIAFGFLLAKENFWDQNWQHAFQARQDLGAGGAGKQPGGWTDIGGLTLLGAVAAAMTGSLFSSDAWNNVTFIAGEIKNPKRNIGLALFFGTLMVTLLYVTANLMYLYVLPLDGIAYPNADRLAISAANAIFSDNGKVIIAVLIMVSTFGCDNGLILAGARVYYTMAKDGLFFRQAGTLNKHAVPQWALWAQCVVACLLCLSGEYGNLLDMISFVVVLFYALTIGGIFILRKKHPNAERPYKAFGYPFLPALYILMGVTFCILLIIYKPKFTWPGLIITLIGIPLYYLALRQKKTT